MHLASRFSRRHVAHFVLFLSLCLVWLGTMRNVHAAIPLTCEELAGVDSNGDPLLTACYDPDKGYKPGSSAPGAINVTDSNWQYLTCFEEATDDCIGKVGGNNSRCCRVPFVGKPGGYCQSGVDARANRNVPEELNYFKNKASDKCKWYDLPCHGGKAIGNFMIDTYGTIYENQLGSVSDALLVCSHDSTPAITGLNSCEDPVKANCKIPGQPAWPAGGSCWCASRDVNSNAVPIVKMCLRQYIGYGDETFQYALLPLRFGVEPINAPVNLQAAAQKEVKEFHNTTSQEYIAWKDKFKQQIQNIITGGRTALVEGAENGYIEVYEKMFGEHFSTGAPLSDPEVARSFTRRNGFFSCSACAKYNGFFSAIGCLPLESPQRFIGEVAFGIGVGIGAAVTLLGLIVSAIQFQLSEGDSTKIQKARKRLTQFATGFLLIVFSIFILRFVGVNLLRIYGLG